MCKHFNAIALSCAVIALAVGLSSWPAATVEANHPVLVEGERDYDGDGLVGLAEDTDNATDRVFGTITAALAGANGGANQNGRVVIVTSGRFHETLVITNANGNTTVEAAPGVEATIDAVATGARANEFPSQNNAQRQMAQGVIVTSPANRYAVLRNLVIRNWVDGIAVSGNSRLTIDNCRLEGNVNHGITVVGSARVVISNSQIQSSGYRTGATGDFPSAMNQPNPGNGVTFAGNARGSISNTTVSGCFNAGIANNTGNPLAVGLLNVNAFDNGGDFIGIRPAPGTTPGVDTSSPFSTRP
jgi:parallel beta-helix repeat protein